MALSIWSVSDTHCFKRIPQPSRSANGSLASFLAGLGGATGAPRAAIAPGRVGTGFTPCCPVEPRQGAQWTRIAHDRCTIPLNMTLRASAITVCQTCFLERPRTVCGRHGSASANCRASETRLHSTEQAVQRVHAKGIGLRCIRMLRAIVPAWLRRRAQVPQQAALASSGRGRSVESALAEAWPRLRGRGRRVLQALQNGKRICTTHAHRYSGCSTWRAGFARPYMGHTLHCPEQHYYKHNALENTCT